MQIKKNIKKAFCNFFLLFVYFDRQPYANAATNLTETYDPSHVLEYHSAYRSSQLSLYHVCSVDYNCNLLVY